MNSAKVILPRSSMRRLTSHSALMVPNDFVADLASDEMGG